ncbi:MAG: alpha/beta fold hydrolase [Chloroflexi bacterium]|nr:alpha/beta fold hydrolase [Chloroflexota bacterium]
MPFANIRDLSVYFEQHGAGPRLLYISGTGGDLRRLPRVFDRPIASRFEILAYDQRGLGQTSRPDTACSMADYAKDAVALLDARGWDRCHMMGVSFGGMVAQEIAARYPQRIDKLVLACTSSGGIGGASYPLHLHTGDSLEMRARRQLMLSDVRRTPAWQQAHRDEFETLVSQLAAALGMGKDEPGRQTGYLRQLAARQMLDTYDRLPALSMPVFICGGRYDGIAPARNQYAMQRQIPHARVELFEGGHPFLLEDPAAYERIIAFLQEA